MNKINFNDGWIYYRDGMKKKEIILPHDAMIYEDRNNESLGGKNISYFEGHYYVYEKTFTLLNQDKEIFIEFEGVYHHAKIYLNDHYIGECVYGYTNYLFDITKYLVYGKENHLKVEVDNSHQPNSRWYSGSGIYRDVNLYLLPKNHILINGVKITTLSSLNKLIQVEIETNCDGKAQVVILDKEKIISSKKVLLNSNKGKCEFELPQCELWDENNPRLYQCKIIFKDDEQVINFGIRQIKWGNQGLLINDKRTILRGCCIHHDNGVIGAVAHPFSEKRKIRLLKEAGYNAIRSAHNPCSKAMLDACDELGMFVLDEYVDCWYIHKTRYDYASYVEKCWRDDLKNMVDKDYNHPSVIMYSTGNEVSETGQKKGIQLTKEFTDFLHSIDNTRPVTCGVNIFFNFLSSIGFGVYSDKKAEKEIKKPIKKKKAVGSEFFNNLAGILGAGFMKRGATLHGCDVKTRGAFNNLDIAGYNYGILRYKHDLKKYPHRLILGSETFCSDAYKFMELAKNNPRIIGDFVWAGMDYIGEVGVGSWTVKEYAKDFDHQSGWLTAGSGRLDITGKATSEMDYTRVAFGLEKIKIGVIPVPHYRMKHSPSSWKYSRAEASWNYHGYDGCKTKVEVYSRANYVELYLNDKRIGKRKLKNRCDCSFVVKYYPGTLKAIAYDNDKNIIGESILKTGGKEILLKAYPENDVITSNDLAYIRFKYVDNDDVLQSLARGIIKIKSIENGELIGFGNGCSYNDVGYQYDYSDTYYGEALCVIKPKQKGDIVITATSPYGNIKFNIKCI